MTSKKRVNMEFDELESENIEEMIAWYGIKQLTELVRFCTKMQYNRMVDDQIKPKIED